MSTPTTRPRIILDCDPGHDDAVAIVVAAHTTELLGITTVSGNASLERTTHNACVLRDMLGLDTGVHAGAARPIVAEPHYAPAVHGESGLDGADLPEPIRGPDGTDAVGFIIDTCRDHDDVWLVPTGPLTNIALALRADPGLVDRIAGISIMGGGRFGNRTPVAEYNIWADPEAAAAVFTCGAPLRLCTLDVTHTFLATPERIERVAALPGRLPAVLADLFRFFSGTYISRHDDIAGAPVHDPLAVLAVSRPDLVTTVRRHVAIETRGELTRGMTVIDDRTLVERPAPNCDLVTAVDADAAWQVVVDALTSL